jgi:hypothetical protein
MPGNVLVRYFSVHSRVSQNFQTGTMGPVPGTFHAIMYFISCTMGMWILNNG